MVFIYPLKHDILLRLFDFCK